MKAKASPLKQKDTIKKKPKGLKESLAAIKNNENGFIKEALALLNEESVSSKDNDVLGAIAELYILTGQPEAGHQKLIRCNSGIAEGLKKSWPLYYRKISWAQPFGKEVAEISQKLNVPPSLIHSIMRRESGFLTRARSWALGTHADYGKHRQRTR